MNTWTGSWAFWAGIASSVAGFAAVIAGLLAARRAPYMPPGSTLPSGAPPEAIEGRAEAIVMLESPATNSECVQYEERVEASAPPGELADDDGKEGVLAQVEDFVPFQIADRAVGVFLVAGETGKAIVWPGLGTVSYEDGWTKRKNDSGDRESDERILRAGTIVRVRGTAGLLSQMLTEMSTEAEDLPEDLLHALQTRADLAPLACYWPNKRASFSVEEEGAVLDEGEDEAGLGLNLIVAAVAFALSALLIFCAYRRIL